MTGNSRSPVCLIPAAAHALTREQRLRSLPSGRASRGAVGRVSKDDAYAVASWFEMAHRAAQALPGERLLTMRMASNATGFGPDWLPELSAPAIRQRRGF